MKKLLLLALAVSFTACEQEECFGIAYVITPYSYPEKILREVPKNCEDGTPDMDLFNKENGNSMFLGWI